ncbi:MAG: hypothetical protein JSR46_05295, partial [Verrucomicrobia bacterium]|nr:hypothetical protein [Verrucomicrobiota bacterium]
MIEAQSPLGTPSQPTLPEKKGNGGWMSGIGGWLIGKYMEHQAPPSLKGKDIALQKYNPLIKDFSKQITDGLVKEVSWLQVGQDSIQTAMEDLIFHIFQVWSKQETDLPQTADQLAEQVFVNLLTICMKELEKEQPLEITFKNIASTILNETFPDKEKDTHLPSVLRGILSHSGIAYHATAFFKPELALDWQGFTDLTAKSLQGVYEKFFDPSSKAGIVERLEEAHPGSSELIEFTVQKIETKAKEPIAIASFSVESNALLNAIVQKFSSEKEAVIQKAKAGFREKVKENMAAVLLAVFEPTAQGQLPQQRREQIVDQLIAATVPKLPQLHKAQAAVKNMEAAEVASFLNALKDLNDSNKIIDINPALYSAVKLRLTSLLGPIRDPAVSEKVYSEVYRYYQPQIELAVARLKTGASIDEGRLLLRQIAAHPTLMAMTNFVLDENKIKAALPDIPEVVTKKDEVAKNSIHKLHNILSEYLLQVQDQLDTLDKEGAKSLEKLQTSGPEVIAYIEEKLQTAQKIV